MTSLIKAFVLAFVLGWCGSALADPPARVGRIAHVQGEADFQAAFDAERSPTVTNWPITSQNIVTTGPHGYAEVRVGATAVRIGPDTIFEVGQLDEQRFLIYLTQGSIHARVNKIQATDEFLVRTPAGRITVHQDALLRVDVDRLEDSSMVSVFQGSAVFDNGKSSLTLAQGRKVLLQESDMHATALTSSDRDAFDRWSGERDQIFRRTAAERYVSPEMTGYEELDRHGVWQQHSAYGTVWFPIGVSGDWAPYRHGQWAWIDPWGWTWIDQASWGYAPTHYGRWVHLDNRWGWIPGRSGVRPVWAPALVGWIGGRDWNASFSFGNVPAIGWFPLGPNERYVPGYRLSDHHLRRLNPHQTVTGPPSVTVSPGQGNAALSTDYRNRFAPNAVSILPQDRFGATDGRRIAPAGSAVAVQPGQLRSAPLITAGPGPAFTTNSPPPVLSTPQFTTGTQPAVRGLASPGVNHSLHSSSPGLIGQHPVPANGVIIRGAGSVQQPASTFQRPGVPIVTGTGTPGPRVIDGHVGRASPIAPQFGGTGAFSRGSVGGMPQQSAPIGGAPAGAIGGIRGGQLGR